MGTGDGLDPSGRGKPVFLLQVSSVSPKPVHYLHFTGISDKAESGPG